MRSRRRCSTASRSSSTREGCDKLGQLASSCERVSACIPGKLTRKGQAQLSLSCCTAGCWLVLVCACLHAMLCLCTCMCLCLYSVFVEASSHVLSVFHVNVLRNHMSYRSACCVLYMQFIYKVCAHEHHHVNHITPNTSAVCSVSVRSSS